MAENSSSGICTKNLETVAKLVGELVNVHEHRHIGLLLSPDYHRLREALTRALAPFPQAARAVAVALGGMEAEALAPPPVPPPS